MKKEKLKFIVAFLLFGITVMGCAKTEEAAAETTTSTAVTYSCPAVTDTTRCSTTFDSTTKNAQLICTPTAGAGRHFCIENLDGSSAVTNKYFYLGLGQDIGMAGTATPAPSIAAASGKFILTMGTNGGAPGTPNGTYTYFRFGTQSTPDDDSLALLITLKSHVNFLSSKKTVCVDVSSATPPRVTFWVSGMLGADCASSTTLTASTALFSKTNWTDATALKTATMENVAKLSGTGAIPTSTDHLKVGKIVVSSNTAIP